MGAAIFGDSYTPERVQLTNHSGTDQLIGLAAGEFDVLMRGATHDFDRQIYEVGWDLVHSTNR